MEDICASAGSSSHQHGDCASAGSSSHQHGDRPYPCWTGARLRSSRSLPGRLSEIMAPLKWPGPVLDYFVDECFKMVQNGRSPANENCFFKTLEHSMSRQSFGSTYCKMDLIQQFRRVRYLWDTYHEILKNLETIKEQEQQSQTDPDKLRLKTGDIYASKFNLIRRYEIKLNTIFETFYGSKAKSLSTYRFNIEHSDRYSGDNSISSKRRSLGEPFSRQLRLKSSDMPESSQNGMAFDSAGYERAIQELHDGGVDDFTYAIACEFLKDPQALSGYSRLSDLKRKVNHLKISWKVKHDPMSVIGNLPPIN